MKKFRVKITRKKGKKGGLRASQGYNSQSSLSADCESITASEVLRRRQQRKDFNKRHTLVGIENAEDLENLQFSPQTTSSGKVKESPVIMDYLKKKYPEHAERIDGRTSGSVMSNGFYETDLDNTDTMSEINTEATGFSRGGRLRSSMPVVRSVVNKTKEKPLGLIFLQYKNETKRALMPNEVTGIDTVRALYVRAFPKQLTMAMLEQPARKIYIMDPSTDIFYELENTDEIIDRTVLKIYEPGFVEDPNAPGPSSPRSTTSTPVELDYYSEPEVDHQKRDVRKNRYNTMTLPRTGASNMQPDGGARQQAAMGNLNPSQDRKHTGSLENFRRGTPERASATLQRPVAQNQAFQRLAPERATLSGPVQRGPGPGHGPGPQGPYGRRGPPPNQQGSATMPRRMPQHDPHHGLGPRPQGSATIPRSQKGGGPTMVDGRPSGGDMRRMDVTPVSKRPQPQVMSAPMPNGHPRQRGPPPQQHPHQQTPPGRPMGPHGTLPRNGAPGMRHPMPNGTGPGPGHPRGQAPLRRHGSHDGTFQDSERISAMEQQIANLAGMVRSVIGTRNGSPRKGPLPQDGQRPAGDHRPVPPVRADAMPITQQAMPITQQPRTPTHQPPLHSRTPDGHSRTPDGHLRPSSHPGAPTSPRGPGVNLQRSAMVMKHRVTDLRMQLKQVRKMHLNMVQQMNNNFKSTSHKIRMALEGAPGSDIHPIRNERAKVHQEYLRYLQTQETIERELRELDENVDKLRDHTINKRGNVNLEEIDQLAQLLGNSSRRIAEQKVNFPVLAEKLKTVQEGEMEIVVREENWMKHEPQRLDDHFKRCKKVTSTLYTLKRMAATHDEPYVISPTSASVSPSTTLTSKHVVRVDTAPYPQSAVIQRQTILADEAEPVVRHDLPHRFKSPLERDLFEQTLSETKGALRQTHNVDANTVRHRRTLRELFDQENHDTMTPIITPEKAAKREAQKEAAATGPSSQKKGPPPPPPPRKHFPASPVPEQSNKKITWSSTQTTPTNKKTKLKSPPPVAAKPQSMKTTTRTTTTTTTTRSAYQVEDVNQALDELESLAFKATDTEDSMDSQAIKDRRTHPKSSPQFLHHSSPSSPNGTIQKPVHAHIRLPQSPSRSFATKPKPLSPRGDKSTTPSKVGGKTSAFVPIKATGPSPKKKEIKPSQQTPPASSSSSSAATSSPSPQQPLATSTPAGKTSSTPVHPSVSSPTAKVEEAKPVNVSTEMKPVEPSTVSITLCSKQVTSRSSQDQKGTVVVKEMTTSSSLSPFASTDLDDFCNSNREEGKNVVAKPESQSKNDENGSKSDKTSRDTVNQGVSNEEVPKVSQSVHIGDRDKMKAEVPTKLTNGNHVEKTVPHTTEIKTIIVNGIIEETSFD
ncbi:SRC kinase signaling inhibitor 1-like isoform X4 [Diadema antillarum]|uniref:SRC kinase signaling inhibitor 1-like isoform X4 n=1 Tax=Diadema antillarum TaxID=105358 RepID=UPI003A8A69BE